MTLPMFGAEHTQGMRFYPSDDERATKYLTQAQVRAYNEAGYVAPLSIFSPRQAERNRASFDGMLGESLRRGLGGYSLLNCHATCESIYDMVVHPALLDAVEDLLGPNIVAWATHFFCKLPGDPKSVSWHQDAPYWPIAPSRTVSAWVAIDDADEENSALRVVPGSHRSGLLSAHHSKVEENNVLFLTLDDAESLGRPVSLNLKAGEASLHSDLLAHGSQPNRSQRRRCGLTIRYASTEVRTLVPGWNERVVLCRGADPAGHWKGCARPSGDTVFGAQVAHGAN